MKKLCFGCGTRLRCAWTRWQRRIAPPDSDIIYEYDVTNALAERIVKTPVIYQPDIKTVQLTYTDARTGEQRKVEEIDWDKVHRLGLNATQWGTDPKPMQQQRPLRCSAWMNRSGG